MSRSYADLEKLVKDNATLPQDTYEVQMDGGNKW